MDDRQNPCSVSVAEREEELKIFNEMLKHFKFDNKLQTAFKSRRYITHGRRPILEHYKCQRLYFNTARHLINLKLFFYFTSRWFQWWWRLIIIVWSLKFREIQINTLKAFAYFFCEFINKLINKYLILQRSFENIFSISSDYRWFCPFCYLE